MNPSRQRWARSLFVSALPTVGEFRSPRAWAFALLGLDAYCAGKQDHSVDKIRTLLVEKLMASLTAVTTTDWAWFEDELAYDNARLPQALIVTGVATATPSYVAAGLKSLRWLMTLQTASAGFFRPIGTEGFGLSRQLPKTFDQQPVEAAATISACIAAWRATRDRGVDEPTQHARFDGFWVTMISALALAILLPGPVRMAFIGTAGTRTTARSRFCHTFSALRTSESLHAPMPRRIGAEHVSGSRLPPEFRSDNLSRFRGTYVYLDVFEPAGSASASGPGQSRGAAFQAGDRAKGPQPDRSNACESRRRPGSIAGCEDREQLLAEVLENFEGVTGTCWRYSRRGRTKCRRHFAPHVEFSKTQRQLIGAYFLHEYSFEAAALFNPSIVAQP